ncbi:acyl-CoA dehydrogenase [Enteractinococcus fodinae]|uniref:Alkylation response protein AidB-like acyl-CoA dehydrogenase n=1 Tax=Enteractinococcus fodinae TaxID=684663 RepID=A0ABU2B5S1_9MICC|nr:acyl-CoA dehydrogenase family protein [Enteractinococcus fodinae]MDR7348334.1 alkylation response protein AidB-like acyl-CoA dehydrogenase [Enteractinococcus fodinae]
MSTTDIEQELTTEQQAVVDAVNAAAAATTAEMSDQEKYGVQFDHGLAWVNFPVGDGGLGVSTSLREFAADQMTKAGLQPPPRGSNTIGFGMAAPTIVAYGNEEQRAVLRKIYTLETIFCQLFSEPGAGSDLAAVATRAVRNEDGYLINGQKVWTSSAHNADMAILVARTDTEVPKHQGLSYFLLDMHAPGVEVRGLRQITGEAEFNEVFLTDVQIPAGYMLGEPGQGWKISNTTLNNERVAIGGGNPREGGMIAQVAKTWRDNPEYRDPLLHDELVRLWVEVEASRMMSERLSQKLAAGQPGPEGSGAKLAFATNNQLLSGLEIALSGVDGLRYDTYEMRRPVEHSMTGRIPGYRYLRAKGNSIEGGTSEIIRNIIAERVLGLPGEHRVDKDVAFKDLPK